MTWRHAFVYVQEETEILPGVTLSEWRRAHTLVVRRRWWQRG